MPDPFASRRGNVFLDSQMPDWSADAACSDKTTIAGKPWDSVFSDVDLTYKASGEYRWGSALLTVMETCAGCPVRPSCLQYGFDMEQPVLLGWRPGIEEEGEDEWIEEHLIPMPVGVYGGVPGPMRQRFRLLRDPIAAAETWFSTLSHKRRWNKPSTAIEEAV